MKNFLTSLYFDNALMIVLLVESFKTFYIKKFKKKKKFTDIQKIAFHETRQDCDKNTI